MRIQSMQTGQRLNERLDTINVYGPEDTEWYHFVRDHRRYLLRRCQTRVFTPETLVKYRYRPQEFVAEVCECPIGMTWIFLFINDLRDPADFNENCTKVKTFTQSLVSDLYQIYSTSANRSRAS